MHDSDTETELIDMRQNFLPLLESYGVDAVYSGHSHSYERSFLIDGHYRDSSTLTDDNKIDAGDGRPGGTGAYNKAAGANAGAVYTVAGSAGKTSDGSLDHPVMVTSKALLGSVVVDINGGRLRQRFLRDTGGVEDRYTLLNDTYEGSYCVSPPHSGGCPGVLSVSGTPSTSDTAPFWITADDLVSGRVGLVFYGYAPGRVPFAAEGTLCVAAPLRRTGLLPTGGGGACGRGLCTGLQRLDPVECRYGPGPRCGGLLSSLVPRPGRPGGIVADRRAAVLHPAIAHADERYAVHHEPFLTADHSMPNEFLILAGAVFVAGFAQGTVGFGFGMISMAVLPVWFSVRELVPVVSLLGVVLSFSIYWRWRSGFEFTAVRPLLFGLAIGTTGRSVLPVVGGPSHRARCPRCRHRRDHPAESPREGARGRE